MTLALDLEKIGSTTYLEGTHISNELFTIKEFQNWNKIENTNK